MRSGGRAAARAMHPIHSQSHKIIMASETIDRDQKHRTRLLQNGDAAAAGARPLTDRSVHAGRRPAVGRSAGPGPGRAGKKARGRAASTNLNYNLPAASRGMHETAAQPSLPASCSLYNYTISTAEETQGLIKSLAHTSSTLESRVACALGSVGAHDGACMAVGKKRRAVLEEREQHATSALAPTDAVENVTRGAARSRRIAARSASRLKVYSRTFPAQ